ncbi:MAG: tetratricopeptide repeat protein [Dictyoglomus turgidum]
MAYLQDLNSLVEYYELKHRENPKDPDNIFNLLVLYGALGNLGKFYDYYNLLNKIDPNYLKEKAKENVKENTNNVFDLYKTAFSYYFLGEIEKSIYYFHKLNSLKPNDDWVISYLAYLYYLKEDYSKVESLINRGFEINEDNEALHALRCALYLKKGNYFLALKEYFITMNYCSEKGIQKYMGDIKRPKIKIDMRLKIF